MQVRSRKISSKATRLLKQLEKSRTPEERRRVLLSEAHLPTMLEVIGRDDYKFRRVLLRELANLHDKGCARFWTLWNRRFRHESDQSVLRLRDEVRSVWNSETSSIEKHRLVEDWLAWRHFRPSEFSLSGWMPFIPAGRLLPDPRNLRGQLVYAVLEQAQRFALCRNPKCPAPYFLARRKDQKYCERGDCTEYAHKQRALSWWNREGNKRRAKKMERRSRKKRR